MSQPDPDLEERVIKIVAETLSVDRADVHLHSSLIDDLGAESIDFLDLVFRLEAAFELKIPEDEIWLGSLERGDLDDPAALQRTIDRLKVQWPDFKWSVFPAQPTRQDLPRLITVQTIVDYLTRRRADAPKQEG